jgi:hypothetical protein
MFEGDLVKIRDWSNCGLDTGSKSAEGIILMIAELQCGKTRNSCY